MKKLLLLLLALFMVTSLVACNSETGNASSQRPPASNGDIPSASTGKSDLTSENDTIQSTERDDARQNSNILIAYFSRVGNTVWEDGVDAVTSASLNVIDGEFAGNAQFLAQMAQKVTSGDLFLIQTVDTYPSDYRETTNVASVEQRENARPELSAHVDNMEQYDIIVLIYPNWWGTLPQPLYTFLEDYDFSGKTILPLCTHEGSRMGSSERAIAGICPDATLLDGLAIRGASAASAQSDVEAWINDSGIL